MSDNLVQKKAVRVCPICNNIDVSILHTQHFQLSVDDVLPTSYDVVSCESCGFVYADTSVTQQDYDFYYKERSKYEDKEISTGGLLLEWDNRRIKDMTDGLESIVSDKQISILDIGCANGNLLFELKERGYTNLSGLDPSHSCVTYVNSLGIEGFQGSIIDVSNVLIKNKQFDLVILSHVLEHMYDLHTVIQNIFDLLKPGGLVYIEVPDSSRYPEYYTVPYHFYDCEHINHFDSNSLMNLFETRGFEMERNEQKEINASEAHLYPAVFIVARKITEMKPERSIEYDSKAKDTHLKYIRKSDYQGINDLIAPIIDTQETVAVWGSGSYTLRLLSSSNLSKCNIVLFLDNDRNKVGTLLNQIPIIHPNELKDFSGKILIASGFRFNEIVSDISERKWLNQTIILK